MYYIEFIFFKTSNFQFDFVTNLLKVYVYIQYKFFKIFVGVYPEGAQ